MGLRLRPPCGERSAAAVALRAWRYLGWTGGARPCALGLFGRLHREFPSYGPEALRLCRKFDERYPEARL